MIKRCLKCNGSKTIKAIGWIEKQCPTCKGAGVIDTETSEERLAKLNKNIETELAKAKAEKVEQTKSSDTVASLSKVKREPAPSMGKLTPHQRRKLKREQRAKEAAKSK